MIKNVFGAFDGYSSGQLALNRAVIPYNNYYASEINKHTISVTQDNFPDTIQLGSITDIETLPDIDLMLGGSPCTNFSFSGKQQGMSTVDKLEIHTLEHYLELKEKGFNFQGQSYLFWEYVRLLKLIKPTYFLLENVKMAKKWSDTITETLGVEPIEINSKLVSAQHRRRLYWTNIPNITQPNDKGILLRDILEDNVGGIKVNYENGMCVLTAKNGKTIRLDENVPRPHTIYEARTEEGKRERRRLRKLLGRDTTPRGKKYKEYLPLTYNKANCLLATPSELDFIVDHEGNYRELTIVERERLQNIPDNYTQKASSAQRKKMIGNGWTIDVIAHILSFIPE